MVVDDSMLHKSDPLGNRSKTKERRAKQGANGSELIDNTKINNTPHNISNIVLLMIIIIIIKTLFKLSILLFYASWFPPPFSYLE